MGKIVRWGVLFVVMLALPAQVLAVSFFISADDILSGAVQTDKLAPAAVTGDKIATGAVTNDKITAGTITKDKLAFTVGSGKYANVVIVAKSGGDFTDPVAAVNSITDASATTPYLVKVMPGVYDLGTGSLQMKEYIDVEGSGDSSVITSINYNEMQPTPCAIATVIMANNSSIRHIKVVNTVIPQGKGFEAIGITFDNVKAKAEDITVEVTGSNDPDWAGGNGICSNGGTAQAILNNAVVGMSVISVAGNYAIRMLNDGSVTLSNSKVKSSADVGFARVFQALDPVNSTGIASIANCTFEMNGQIGASLLYQASGYNFTVANSTISLSSGGSASMYSSGNPAIILNSKISANAPLDLGNVRIANSLIQGTFGSVDPSVKLLNNFDGDFNPIPNQ